MSALPTGPFLTARADGASARILDPLGLDATGASMVRQYLFPGMTGGLRHVRYFSLMTWMVGSFGRTNGGVRWPPYARRLEHALRIGALEHAPELTGLVGRRSTPPLSGLSGSALMPLDKRLPSVFEAQYYGASFGALGLAKRVTGEAPRLTQLGASLFDALEAEIAVEDTSVRRALERLRSGPADMRVADLHAAASFLQLRQVRPGDPEFAPLKDALVGVGAIDRPSDGARGVRGRSLSLVLAILGSPGSAVADWRDLLEILQAGRVSQPVKEAYEAELVTWRCFGERQEQRVAFGAFWHVILEWMRTARPFGVGLDVLVKRAVDLLPTHGVPPLPLAGMDWGTYEDTIADSAGITATRRHSYRQSLMASVSLKGDPSPTAEERISVGLQLVAACTSSWRLDQRSADIASLELHSHGHAARMTLPWFADQLQAKRSESVAAVLRWLVERCVLNQVQRVGYAKGPGISKVLLVREEDEVRFARDAPFNDPFAQDANRLSAALALLEGLSLIRWKENCFVSTASGDAVLRKHAAAAPAS